MPAVFNVQLTLLIPLSLAEKKRSPGNTAAGSLLVKWTVPEYPVAVKFAESKAVTVTG